MDNLEVVPGSEPLPESQPEEAETTVDTSSPVETAREKPKSGPKGGRPRKDSMPAGSSAPVRVELMPSPRFTTFKSDALSPVQRSKAGFTWWGDLPGWAKDRIVAYVYRDWPLLKNQPRNGDPDDLVNENIDKIPGNEPLTDDNDLLHRYGCGNYRVRLNDYPPGGQGKTLCIIHVVAVGGSDLKSFPPADRRVSDVAQVDLDHPSNKSYVEFLRMRGLLPEQSNKAEKEAEVAATEAVKEMVGQNAKLTDRLFGMVESKSKEGDAATTMIVESAKTAIQMAKDSADAQREEYRAKIRDLEGVSGERRGTSIDEVIKLAQLMHAPANGSDEAAALRAELAQVRMSLDREREDRIKSLEQRILDMAKNPAPVAPSPFSSMDEMVNGLRKVRELTEEMSGGSGPAPTGIVEEVASGGPKWLGPVIDLAGKVVTAFMMQRQGAPAPPTPQQPAYAPPAPPQGPGPMLVAPPAAQPNGIPPEVTQILDRIAKPLERAINEGMAGDQLGGWYIDGYGVLDFNKIKDLGVDTVLQILMAYPPTAQTLSGLTDMRRRQFVVDFLKAEPAQPEDEEEDDAAGDPNLPVGLKRGTVA